MTSPLTNRRRVPSDDRKYGLTHLNPASETDASRVGRDQQTSFEVDIVAIHGINGHAFKTWTHGNGAFWLRDFLPIDLLGARVFTFGYESEVAFTLSTGKLEDFARSLLVALKGTRKSEKVG